MSVIEVQLWKHRNKTEAKGNENAFLEWLERMGLGNEGFEVSVRSQQTYKGKPVTFFVSSYGAFQTFDGYQIYISYRGDVVNHVRYHAWRWDGKRADVQSHTLNEFINI